MTRFLRRWAAGTTPISPRSAPRVRSPDFLTYDADQTAKALAMTVIPHFASDEIELSELNSRGDLTMWKRFNGADAVRNSLQACLLASVGVKGAVRPFVGQLGFIHKLANDADDAVRTLRAKLDAKKPLTRVCETYFKRWPVGSLAQSSIQAALQARKNSATSGASKRFTISPRKAPTSISSKFEKILGIRSRAKPRMIRCPYIVAAAMLDGHVRTDSFDPARVLQPARQRFVAEKVKAQRRAQARARSPAAS